MFLKIKQLHKMVNTNSGHPPQLIGQEYTVHVCSSETFVQQESLYGPWKWSFITTKLINFMIFWIIIRLGKN